MFVCSKRRHNRWRSSEKGQIWRIDTSVQQHRRINQVMEKKVQMQIFLDLLRQHMSRINIPSNRNNATNASASSVHSAEAEREEEEVCDEGLHHRWCTCPSPNSSANCTFETTQSSTERENADHSRSFFAGKLW